jgi:hypothetical protein
LANERDKILDLDLRIREVENEYVPESAATMRLAELAALRLERNGIRSNGEVFQNRLDLRQRQGAAGEFPIPEGAAAADRRQPTLNSGRTPRRRMVRGDQDYLRDIMANSRSKFTPTQNHIYAETVNDHVTEILTTGRFPRYDIHGVPSMLVLREEGPGIYVIRQGHHRLVAGQIAARLTGRPLLPWEAALRGETSIIPADRLMIEKLDTKVPTSGDTRDWTHGVGVR